jgi:hypothetical protein
MNRNTHEYCGRPVTLFEGANGAYTTARSLTPDEAVTALDRGHLSLLDLEDLSADALDAVLSRSETFIARDRAHDGSPVVFGVRGPAFARHGRA